MEHITREQLKQLLHYDPLTGVFTRLVNRGRYRAGATAGYDNHGYTDIRIGSRGYRAHRLAWLYMTGTWPVHEIDHRNDVKHDNRWVNLRDVPHAVNVRSTAKHHAGNYLGIRGVRRTRSGSFQARITVDGRVLSLGTHPTPEAAAQAYADAQRSHT